MPALIHTQRSQNIGRRIERGQLTVAAVPGSQVGLRNVADGSCLEAPRQRLALAFC